jgi:hypothetical protein
MPLPSHIDNAFPAQTEENEGIKTPMPIPGILDEPGLSAARRLIV